MQRKDKDMLYDPKTRTKYQPIEDERIYPQCGTGIGELIIDDSACEAEDCDAVHRTDEIKCLACGYQTIGSRFAAQIARKKALIPCRRKETPTCRVYGNRETNKVIAIKQDDPDVIELKLKGKGK